MVFQTSLLLRVAPADKLSASSEKLMMAILEIVDNQLKDNTPPETRETYQRLLNEGFSSDEARELIAAVVKAEILKVLKTQQPYDPKRFVEALHKLPRLS